MNSAASPAVADTDGGHHVLRFRVFAALAMASGAISIDSILPAFAAIRHELGLSIDSSATAGLITTFFLGLAIGQIPIGIVADWFGRRPAMFVSIAIFLAGVAMMAVSHTLTPMLFARFVWGVGAAGLRTGAIAMVRDKFVGAAMAREMAFVMAVFLVVPVIAPTLGAWIMHAFTWRMILGMSAAFGIFIGVLTSLMPETLDPADRQPLRLGQVAVAAKAIVEHRTTLRYALVLTAIFGVFSSYLASSERIVGDIFGRRSQFPILFGAVGVLMGVASILVGRRVERIGLARLIRAATLLYCTASLLTLAVVLLSDRRPEFWMFWVPLTCVLVLHNIVFPNASSAAMIPLGHVAGTASAVMGTVSTAGGAAVGALIDHLFDGTVGPLTVAFAVSGIIAVALVVPIKASARH